MPASIDDALDVLGDRGPEFGSGMSNHGPMVAEALLTLGRPDAVLPYAENYRRRLDERPALVAVVDPGAWQDALGDVRRVSDWSAFFVRAIEDEGWQATVRRWVPRLAPGVMAGATHGLIRTAHAVRSLGAAETPARLHELAEGLGYWAARYQPLPGSPRGRDAGLDPAEAMHRLPRYVGENRGLIFESVRGLDEQPSFASAIDLVDTSGDLSRFISRMTATSAAVFLANPQSSFQFIHAVTAPSALRMLAPYLADTDARRAARYAWQAVAGLYAWFAVAPPLPVAAITDQPVDSANLADRAVRTMDEHAIKFTEACLREERLAPNPAYRVAASGWVERLEQRRDA
jgi:hypothetical protein